MVTKKGKKAHTYFTVLQKHFHHIIAVTLESDGNELTLLIRETALEAAAWEVGGCYWTLNVGQVKNLIVPETQRKNWPKLTHQKKATVNLEVKIYLSALKVAHTSFPTWNKSVPDKIQS